MSLPPPYNAPPYFPAFDSQNNALYPVPVSNLAFSNTASISPKTYPTCSWFQNSLSTTINDGDRTSNAVPWYWLTNYTAKQISIGYANTIFSLSQTINGNVLVGEIPGQIVNSITTGTASPTNLQITYFDDFVAQITQTNATGTVTAYPTRGTPYATFVYNNVEVILGFTVFNSSTTVSFTPITGGYSITGNGTFQTQFDAEILPVNTSDPTPTQFTVNECSFYDGPDNTGWNVSILYDRTTYTINYTVDIPTTNYSGTNVLTFTINLATKVPPIVTSSPPNVTNITYTTGSNSPQPTSDIFPIVQIAFNSGSMFEIDANLDPTATPNVITLHYSHTQMYQYYIFTTAPLIFNNSNKYVTTAGLYTGLIQIACAGKVQNQWSALQTLYSTYAGGYATQGNVNNFSGGASDNNWSFNISWAFTTPPANGILWLAPNHWNLMTLTGMTNLTSSNYPLIQEAVYGNLTWYTITSTTTTVGVSTQSIPLAPDISSFTNNQKTMLINMIRYDIGVLYETLPGHIDTQGNPTFDATFTSGPYQVGNFNAALGRVLYLGMLLGMTTADPSPCIDTNFANVGQCIGVCMQYLNATLTSYLNGTCYSNRTYIPCASINAFQLEYDSNWGGVLIPGDFWLASPKPITPGIKPNSGCDGINPFCPGSAPGACGQGNFGNTFYNDHHFHWGYLLYAMYMLELIGNYYGVTVVTPSVTTTFSNQIIGLITDICNPVISNYAWKTRHKDWYGGHSYATGAENSIIRQQESSGEGINGYYGAYLMCRALNSHGLLSNPSLKSAAGVCLWTEILASQQYYQMKAPGSRLGLLSRTGGIGILQNCNKTFSLDWGMDPDSFNGRALGIYGIQSVPFTEITFHLLSNYWATILSKVKPYYALNSALISTIMNQEYTPTFAPNEYGYANFNPLSHGVFWGIIGLKIIAFSQTAMSDSDISTAFTNAFTLQYINNPNITTPKNIVNLYINLDSFTNTLYLLFKLGRNVTVPLLQSPPALY